MNIKSRCVRHPGITRRWLHLRVWIASAAAAEDVFVLANALPLHVAEPFCEATHPSGLGIFSVGVYFGWNQGTAPTAEAARIRPIVLLLQIIVGHHGFFEDLTSLVHFIRSVLI